VNFSDDMVKTVLLKLVKLNRPAPAYVIDDIIRQHGHEILRLPPYHPDFNPIELIWSQLKSIVRVRNMTFRYVSYRMNYIRNIEI
jgi:transposase